ncbi:hypothetical protein Tco_0971455 [Tanacetum coccineum]
MMIFQAAGSDTRPPMLDRTDYESWLQRIRLYCRGKENGLQILQSIDEGPFELGTTRGALGTTPYKSYLGQRQKASLAVSELQKKIEKSQLYDEFERSRSSKTNNQLRTSSNTRNQATIQDGRVVIQNVQGQQNQNQSKNCTQPKLPQNSDNFKDQDLLRPAQETGSVLDEEELLILGSGELGKHLYADRVSNPQAVHLMHQILSECNLYRLFNDAIVPRDPIAIELKIYKEQFAIYEQRAKFELTERKKAATALNDGDERHTSHSFARGLTFRLLTIKKNIHGNFTPQTQRTRAIIWSLIYQKQNPEELKVQCKHRCAVLPPAIVYPPNTPAHLVPRTLPTTDDKLNIDVFYTAMDSVLNVSRFSDMHDAFTSAQKRIANLESENFNLRNKNQNDDHALVSQNKDLTAKLNALHDLNERFRAENAKVKQHYKELYDSIKITRAKTTDQNNSLLSEIENLKAQLKDNSKCVTIPDSKPKVLAPGRYPIDVEPIPPRLKKNREVHLHYIKHLKENVETLREIVEDAKVERPLDTSLASACRYTKHSQELLEYVIGTCPKDFGPSDKQNASTNSLRKKRVNFVEPCETSTHNTPPQVEHQKINSTNAPGIPSTGVKGASAASRSKPRSNTKKDRTLPARSALKQVEAHSRMNKSNEKQENRVDSSISFKRTVINSNSNSLCKTCNECLISSNHVKCVERFLKSYNKSPVKQIWRVKQKPTGRLIPLGGQCPLVRPTAPTNSPTPVESNLVVQIVLWYLDSGCSKHTTGDRSRLRNFVNKFIGTVRFGNDHFGAIMGYGDYVIGDSVISRVYYVEGLGYNLFSVGQFCDSDLEVAFRKHMCFVRDLDGVDLIKGNCGMNLYTISVEDMMRSSLICLLSKASNNKS